MICGSPATDTGNNGHIRCGPPRAATLCQVCGEVVMMARGRLLDDREREDLATFVRWVVRGHSA